MTERNVEKQEKADLVVTERGLQVTSLTELGRLADALVAGQMAPKGSNKATVVVAMLYGMNVGLSPLQAIQHVAVINGRPSLWGSGIAAVILHSGLLESAPETVYEGQGDQYKCTVTMRRKGVGAVKHSFSWADAKAAKLTSKDPWRCYPARMLYWRAYGRCANDLFADVLKGLYFAEEAVDLEPSSYTVEAAPTPQNVTPQVAPPVAPWETPAPAQAQAQVGVEISAGHPQPVSAPVPAQAPPVQHAPIPAGPPPAVPPVAPPPAPSIDEQARQMAAAQGLATDPTNPFGGGPPPVQMMAPALPPQAQPATVVMPPPAPTSALEDRVGPAESIPPAASIPSPTPPAEPQKELLTVTSDDVASLWETWSKELRPGLTHDQLSAIRKTVGVRSIHPRMGQDKLEATILAAEALLKM